MWPGIWKAIHLFTAPLQSAQGALEKNERQQREGEAVWDRQPGKAGLSEHLSVQAGACVPSSLPGAGGHLSWESIPAPFRSPSATRSYLLSTKFEICFL